MTTIILHIIYIFNIILLTYFLKNLFFMLFSKCTDIYQYKILDKYLSAIIIITYISLLIIGLYIYRLYNLGNYSDLKFVYNVFLTYVVTDSMPLVFKIYFFLHGLLFSFIAFLLFITAHKYSFLEIYKVFLFTNYRLFLRDNTYTKNFYYRLNDIGPKNLLSYIIISLACHTTWFLKALEINHGATYNEFETPEYSFYNICHNIVNHRFLNIKHIYTFDLFLYYFIPILLLIYDSIYNDFMITHIFYYLPFIIPISLLQRITKAVSNADNTIHHLMWEIYYKKDVCIYACTKEQKVLLDTYLINGLQMLPGLDLVFLSENLYIFNNSPLHFRLIDKEHYMYQNDMGDYIQKQQNGDYFFVEDYLFNDDNPYIILNEKMILIADKIN